MKGITEQIIRLKKQGLSYNKLAQRFDISVKKVKNLIRQYNKKQAKEMGKDKHEKGIIQVRNRIYKYDANVGLISVPNRISQALKRDNGVKINLDLNNK